MSPAGLSPNVLGSSYMAIGSLGYVVNDALVRAATDEGLDVYQALFLRGVAMATLFAAAGEVRRERLTLGRLRRPLIVRVLAEMAATALFFAAVVQLPFANAQTILMLVPFAVTVVAAVHLGEHVSTQQYAAVTAGFVGVLVVMRPATDSFSWWSLAAAASAALMVVRELATRRVDRRTPALPIALLTAVGLTALTGIISIFTGWGDMSRRGLVLVAFACLCLVIGYVFTIETVRVGDLSVSAPFRYTTLVGAVVIGAVFFEEVPDLITLAGCLVIVLAGVASIRLERRTRVLAPPVTQL
jgi:drug/metabolite transporter (DMT)-like permease